MNNFELLDKWCETCLDYINPLLWKEIQSRGLVNIVNYLPSNIEEAKVEVGRRMQEFVSGRFGRKSGDFLCTSKNGSNGENWSGQALLIRHTDGNGTGYMPEPTCKQCLKILSKYKI